MRSTREAVLAGLALVTTSLLALTEAGAVVPLDASSAAIARSVSGTMNGASWTAQSTIVGQTSTATVATGGNPAYLATGPAYRGVVGVLMDYGAGGRFVCSGALLSDRQSVLTAGHCVSGGAGTPNPVHTTVFFANGSDPDVNVYAPGAPGVTAVDVAQYHVNPLYTGEVIDQNDIAVLTLSQAAPAFATGYNIYTGGDLTGKNVNIAGYGNRSVVGGAEGTTGPGAGAGTGRLRQADNRYDFRLGDPDFDGFFTDVDPATGERFFGTADVSYSYLTDFDDGLAANDASCILATGPDGLGVAPSAKYCDTGVGALEGSTAGGDSGGPQFIDGEISSVTSYGLTFGTGYGDYKDGLNNSWGEFNGFVPTYIHAQFIADAIAAGVPEPASWMMMVAGFGAVGAAVRRRGRVSVSFG